MKCPYCENDVPMNVSTCPSCGAQVPQLVQAPVAQQLDGQPNSQIPQGNMTPPAAKSATAYVLLAIFLGMLGIHNFYIGFNGKGTAQLLISLLTCGYGAIVSWIWAICEVVSEKKDANGIPFK